MTGCQALSGTAPIDSVYSAHGPLVWSRGNGLFDPIAIQPTGLPDLRGQLVYPAIPSADEQSFIVRRNPPTFDDGAAFKKHLSACGIGHGGAGNP